MSELPFDKVNRRHFSTSERELKLSDKVLHDLGKINDLEADLGNAQTCIQHNTTKIAEIYPDHSKVTQLVLDVADMDRKLEQTKLDIEESIEPKLEEVKTLVNEFKTSKVESMYYDEFGELDAEGHKYWYAGYDINNIDTDHLITNADGNPVAYDFGIGGTGGGGGDDTTVKVSAINWPSAASLDVPCVLQIEWSSYKEETMTGPGTIIAYVNGTTVFTRNGVAQGLYEIDLTDKLISGTNKIEIRAIDAYGNSGRVVSFITGVSVRLDSNFDDNRIFYNVINYTYIPTGLIEKTTHFILDGIVVGKDIVSTSGEQQTHQFKNLTHGSHSLEVYFTCELEGNIVESNHLYYDLIYAVEGNKKPIIASTFKELEQEQYNSFNIEYRVFTPDHNLSEVDLLINDEVVQSLVVGQDTQYWEHAFEETGFYTMSIQSGSTIRTFNVHIHEATVDVQAVTADLSLYMNTLGRSNSEEHPELWQCQKTGLKANLTGFNFTSDGWQQDADKNTVLRVTGDARVEIPYKIFANDFKSSGKTIELEFATTEIRNYDTQIISCFSGDRGFYITPQLAKLKSQQSEVQTQYKEDDHVRITFVIEKNVETHLILMYINGVMSGAVQYPLNDNFRQLTPVNISIGSNDATLDIYNIRIYDNNLNRKQVVNNWIADTQSGKLKVERFRHNNNYNEAGEITIEMLPDDLPYMVYDISELPTYKGDKRIANKVSYVDPVDDTNSFEALGAEMNVQGTSSQYYFRKNFKIKYGNGLDQAGEHKSKYEIRPGAIAEKSFTYKADVASSEGANNVELVRFFEDSKHWVSPAEVKDDRVRVGIDGFPYVAFHNDGEKTYFYGKMNFNNDKGNKDTFGFKTNYDEAGNYIDGDESWEMTNNNTLLDLFKSGDMSNWEDAFESRYPDDNTPDGHVFGYNQGELDRLTDMVQWVASTDRDVDGLTEDEKARRLAKFKNELTDRFDLQSTLFYYLFTELFLMVDSRAKNAFPTYMKSRQPGDGGDKWFWFPYDMDTAIGTNNEGLLQFGYNLEDTDIVDGAFVYNGQRSVMWNNVRDAFGKELAELYANLRSGNVPNQSVRWTYDNIENRFEEHQNKWSEAIFNEDSYSKCLLPLILNNDATYLGMLQGSKAEQRKWWLFNRFRYLDSKYGTGNALENTIMMRAYQKSDFNMVPYANIYLSANFDDQVVSLRAEKDKEYLLKSPASWDPHGTDSVVGIRSADQLKEIGDISGFYVGYADFSKALKLQKLIVGSADPSYRNEKLEEINIGNNKMLSVLDVRNCPNLRQSVDVSGCTNIEHLYFDGTSITGVSLPNGGILKTLHLPGTITNLTLRNQTSLQELVLDSTENVQTLWLENIPSDLIDAKEIVMAMPEGAAVRLIGFNQTVVDVSEIYALYDLLDTMSGLNAQGEDVPKAQVNGVIKIDHITFDDYAKLSERYVDVRIESDRILCSVDFYNEDTLYDHQVVVLGGDAETPAQNPTKESTVEFYYDFEGWDTPYTNVQKDIRVNALYSEHVRSYNVIFDPQTSLIPTETKIVLYNTLVDKPEDPHIEGTVFEGWYREPDGINLFDFSTPILGDITLYAKFRDEEAPIIVKVERLSFDTFKYTLSDNVAVTAYAITQSDTIPVDWTPITPVAVYTNEYKVDSAGKYYIWARDKAGFMAHALIEAFSITTNATVGCEILVREDNVPINMFALQGTKAQIEVNLDMHYENLVVKCNNVIVDAVSAKFIDEDTIIVATCSPKIYTINYEMNGRGEQVPKDYVVYNNLIREPESQFEDGYIIKNWCIDAELLKPWNFSTMAVDGPMTLYANWIEYKDPNIITVTVTDNQYITCSYWQSKSKGVTVNWGDGSEVVDSDLANYTSLSHAYDVAGTYEIKITCIDGTYRLGGGNANNPVIKPAAAINSVVFAYNMASTEAYCFYGASNLTTIDLTRYMNTVAANAFRDCAKLKNITIPSTILKIGDNAFANCAFSGEFSIPETVLEIGKYAFQNCSEVTKFNILNQYLIMNDGAFAGCTSLTEFTFPENLTELPGLLLRNCTGLTELIIPESVELIGEQVFEGCSNLRKVALLNPNLKLGMLCFNRCTKLRSAGPIGEGYDIEFAWTEAIPDYAFQVEFGVSNTSLTEVHLPDTIKTIGVNSFWYQSRLNKINLPVGLITISDNAFYRCESLVLREIPNTVKTIGSSAFLRCSSLNSLILPMSIISIGNNAFEMTGLSEVYLHFFASDNKVHSPEFSWFKNCYNNNLLLHVRTDLFVEGEDLTKEAYGLCWNYKNDSHMFNYVADID